MNITRKTWKKATYFYGKFELRNINENWIYPIEFPGVFIAYGKGINSGHWQTGTSLSEPDYVIDYYFDIIGRNKNDTMYQMWIYCIQLSTITWVDVNKNKKLVLDLIELANNELDKLKIFN